MSLQKLLGFLICLRFWKGLFQALLSILCLRNYLCNAFACSLLYANFSSMKFTCFLSIKKKSLEATLKRPFIYTFSNITSLMNHVTYLKIYMNSFNILLYNRLGKNSFKHIMSQISIHFIYIIYINIV